MIDNSKTESQQTPLQQDNLEKTYPSYYESKSINDKVNITNNINKSKNKKQWSTVKVIALCLVCSLLSAAVSAGVFAISQNKNNNHDFEYYPIDSTDDNTDDDKENNSANESDTGTSQDITINVENVSSPATAVAKKVSPSIVGIRVTTVTNYGPYGNYESSGEGSGVIYTKDGYIITNYHVIEEMVTSSGENNPNSTLTVYLNQDTSKGYEAKVIGYEQSADLAVIKIEATGLTAVEIWNSDSISVGDIAIAIGNPGGL